MEKKSKILYVIVSLVIVIGAGLLFMRGRGSPEPTTPDSPTLDGRRNDQGQGGENMKPNPEKDTQPGPVTNPINPGP